MRKSKKIIFIVLFCLLMICGFILFRKAMEKRVLPERVYSEISMYADSEQKKLFADEKDALYLEAVKLKTIKEFRKEEVDVLMEAVVRANDEEKAEWLQELEEYGVYMLELQQKDDTLGNTYIMLQNPTVFYNAIDQTWTVCSAGEWNEGDWRDIAARKSASFGISYRNITDIYETFVSESFAYLSDGEKENVVETENRSGSTDGFSFVLKNDSFGIFQKKYVGERWYGYCVYDSTWKNFSSYIVSYYDFL